MHRPLFVYRRYHELDRALRHGGVPKGEIEIRNNQYHYRRNYIDFDANKSNGLPSAIHLNAISRRTKRRASLIHRPLFVFRKFHRPNREHKSVPDNEQDERRRI